MSGDICALASFAYDNGQDAITYAEQVIVIQLDVRSTVYVHRLENPDAFPLYGPDLTLAAVARRIIGELLDAGWTPPEAAER